MSKSQRFLDLIEAMKIAGGENTTASDLIGYLDKLGREGELHETDGEMPIWSKEKWEKEKSDIEERGRLVGIDPPKTYEDYLQFMKINQGDIKIPHFKMIFPEEIKPHEIAIFSVRPDFHPLVLPGNNLAGYATNYRIEKGFRSIIPTFYYTELGVDSFWLGLDSLRYLVIAMNSIFANERLNVEDEIKDIVREMLSGAKKVYGKEEGQLTSSQFVSKLMIERFPLIEYVVNQEFPKKDIPLEEAREGIRKAVYIITTGGVLDNINAPGSQIEYEYISIAVVQTILHLVVQKQDVLEMYKQAGRLRQGGIYHA